MIQRTCCPTPAGTAHTGMCPNSLMRCGEERFWANTAPGGEVTVPDAELLDVARSLQRKLGLRPHLFSPDALSRTDPAIRESPAMALCWCGYGPRYRAHQRLRWRLAHLFRNWR